ncbi:hypothetical protein PIB30_049497 [Stylosanthes scabra]|uniref:Disease resistance RPP13-like protein 1 n=1 Tax=Stylosanthes scabra TaxID=79078 RepID=A0ABU6SI11_9FABA|nr:hypothetical protein [Stylosanthes scabra]
MAAALVVGALVSGFANVVLDRLISFEFVNLVVGKKLNKKLINRLRTAILAAKALAADAEQKQFGDELVREWLDSLRDALYTADDLLDRVFTKAQIRSKVRPRLPGCLHLSDRKMVTKIEDVIERIEDLERRKDILGLRVLQTGSSSSWRPTPSTSLEKGTVYGRDADKQALMKMLNDNNDHKLSVISIVGLGGVGKTTLAQWLYNNEDLMKGFDPKAWVCVSENFDVVETTKNVIKEISSGVCSLDGFNLLQQDLKGKLSQKKFFIILDDVWSEDADKWNSFITPFQHGRNGSTLLLTTRNKNVGPRVQNYYSYPLEGLSDDYCWSIFAANASFPESNGCSELEEIGRMIVKRCDGLPLAAETLGRLLHSEHHVEEWKKILSSDIWELSITDNLLPPPKKGETLEAVGYECFDDLASRMFFKQVQENDEKHFVMHDLMHDLATFLAGKFYCRLSEGENEEMRSLTRHLSCDHPISEKTYSSSKIESLRTFLNTDHGPLWIEKESARILSKNKYLRVLSSEKLSEFPGSIVKLIHLHYLDVSRSAIKTLPESLGKLSHLQTLKLSWCSELMSRPKMSHDRR